VQTPDYVIERVTNKPVSNYLETKIWKPLGMEAAAIGLDRDDEWYGKSFCCLARTVDLPNWW
jgi:CubicO group peptidase (beta-lactamase class C family)